MFPASFNAQVAQRMMIWGAMLAFLLLLYGATEIVRYAKTGEILRDLELAATASAVQATANEAVARIAGMPAEEQGANAIAAQLAVLAKTSSQTLKLASDEGLRMLAKQAAAELGNLRVVSARAAVGTAGFAAFMETNAKIGRALIERVESAQGRLTSLAHDDQRNKMLIGLLAAFVVTLIAVLERRWLVAPLIRLAQSLGNGGQSLRDVAADSMRRDEIGNLARAVEGYVGSAERQRAAASEEQARLNERLARQDEFRHESLGFQGRIAAIVEQLEAFSGRMSEASRELQSISSDADRRAVASAESTQRASTHIDVVAASVGEVSATLAAAAAEAEGTSEVVAAARQLAQSASRDATELTDAARTIEQVIKLIQGVANQTNLLALNATIEAARAGEAGRGFAVVASEVKQLATRTSRATDEIREGLEGINLTATRMAERVAKLVESIGKVEAAAAVIAASMRRQGASSQTIASNTEQTAKDVREVADTVHHVAGLIAETRRAAEMVTRVSTELGEQSGALRSAVQRFVATSERAAA
jgi:methyl-accepting chemotaxis protein